MVHGGGQGDSAWGALGQSQTTTRRHCTQLSVSAVTKSAVHTWPQELARSTLLQWPLSLHSKQKPEFLTA